MNNESYEKIQDIVYSNYEDIRNELLEVYNTYNNAIESSDSIFKKDIDNQYIKTARSAVTRFIIIRTSVSIVDILSYVEDKFTFDNIERIISNDGEFK